MMRTRIAVVLLAFGAGMAGMGAGAIAPAQAAGPAAVQSKVLLQTETSWDGSALAAYPAGKPEMSVLRISIPPNTALAWHTHPMPNAAYVLSGDLLVEKKEGGQKKRIKSGEVLPELVGVAHRGVTGKSGAVLIVFYAGTKGMPLSEPVKASR